MNTTLGNRSPELFKIIIHICLMIFTIVSIIPIILVVAISLMNEKEIWTTGYTFFPKNISLAAYKMILGNPEQLTTSYIVTSCVTIIGTIAGLWLTTTLAYITSRKDYRFRKQVSFYIFFTMLFNGGIVPSYILIVSWLHLKDKYIVYLIPYLCVAYYVFLMRGFLQNTPESIIESAKIDGASEFRVFVRIILPISKPALATVGLLIAFSYWNDWFSCLMYIDDPKKYMLQFLLIRIMQNVDFLNSDFARITMHLGSQDIPSYSARMALCVLAAGPMLFIFPFFQKYFVKGLTVGAVKG